MQPLRLIALSWSQVLLPAPQVSYLLGGPALCSQADMHALTESSDRHSTPMGPLQIPAQTLCPNPGPPTHHLFWLEVCSWITCTHCHAHQGLGMLKMVQWPPAAGTRHMGCDPQSCSSGCHWASGSLCSPQSPVAAAGTPASLIPASGARAPFTAAAHTAARGACALSLTSVAGPVCTCWSFPQLAHQGQSLWDP